MPACCTHSHPKKGTSTVQVAHVLARHHAERLSQLNITGLFNILTRALLGINIPGALVVVGMFLPYSRYE